MEQSTQERARAELIKQYEVWAFEALANYNYFGQKLKPIEDGIKHSEKVIGDCRTKISLIQSSSDRHTKENREKVKIITKDIEDYEKRVVNMRSLGEKSEKEVIAWRERGVQFLEQIENFKIFKLRTPEEIKKEQEENAKVLEEKAKQNPNPNDIQAQ